MFIPEQSIIAVGPVIIEDNKILLNREFDKDGLEKKQFMIPGGKINDYSLPLEDTCRREVMEELGLEIEILSPLDTIMIPHPKTNGVILLVHYLAKRLNEVEPGERTIEWDWFGIDALPDNVADNVRTVVETYKKHNQ
ncbi:NUDIX hydrolase [Patescibacteria group bacterium]|nr:NUDIX hydrolase [Patescibacteria group bacterium]MBU1721758.1 NUDIX hydrolase [Patescibacteria group bacterium]MBU1901403.1 NUDIX hydrolase [Patescibacteria group bacterium]